jgi:hypothetical protein
MDEVGHIGGAIRHEDAPLARGQAYSPKPVRKERRFYLRLAPAKNNQRVGLKWASEYADIGAIAQLGER